MFEADELMNMVIRRAQQANPPADGDYTDEEGFVCCGKCHTRRQTEITMPDPHGGEPRLVKVPVSCKCRKEEEDRRKKREEEERELQVIQGLRGQSLMDERLSDAAFASFVETEKNKRNLKLCRRYAEKFDDMYANNQGLLFYGGVGTGKTFAAACIANYLLSRRVPVVMTSFVKLLETMQGFKEEEEKLIAKLNRAKLLIIDDLGAERSTDYALEKVYNIVDSRYRAKKPLILTTNLSMDEMKDTADLRYGRIYDRIFELCYPMQFVGPSWRRREATRRFNDMKALLEDD